MDTELKMIKQPLNLQYANYCQQTEVILPLWSALVRYIWSSGCSAELPSKEEIKHTRVSLVQGLEGDERTGASSM